MKHLSPHEAFVHSVVVDLLRRGRGRQFGRTATEGAEPAGQPPAPSGDQVRKVGRFTLIEGGVPPDNAIPPRTPPDFDPAA